MMGKVKQDRAIPSAEGQDTQDHAAAGGTGIYKTGTTSTQNPPCLYCKIISRHMKWPENAASDEEKFP